jgi:hypothetical protein
MAATALSERLAITLERCGQWLVTWQPCALLERLMTRRVGPRLHARYGCEVVSRPMRFFRPCHDFFDRPGSSCLAGLEPVVVEFLTSSGYAVAWTENDDKPELHAPGLGRLDDFAQPDLALVEFVAGQTRGVIRYRHGPVELARLVGQVALAWPTARVLVIASVRRRAHDLWKGLRQLVPEAALSTGRWPYEGGSRVVVATPGALGMADIGRRDLVFAEDAVQATRGLHGERIVDARRARLFGFLEVAAQPSPFEADLIASLFGFGSLTIPRHGHVERGVEVAWARIEGGPRLSPELDVLGLKRYGLWRHVLRNRRIARLAEAVVKDDQRPAGLSPTLAAAVGCLTARDVIIVVENVEHALALAQYLPNWRVRVAQDGLTVEGLPPEQIKRLQQRRSWAQCAQPSGTIVTVSALEPELVASADILIRADGGLGKLALPANALTVPCDDRWPLLLVDFLDRHDPRLRLRSRQRAAAYEKEGWHRAGMDPEHEAVIAFLRAHTTRRQR